MAITLSILNEFSIFFHCWKEKHISNKIHIILPTTPSVCCRTTLQNLEVRICGNFLGERTVLVLGTQCSSHYRTVTAGGVAGVIGSFRPKAATCASLTFCVRAELLWDGPGNHDVIAFGVIHSGSDDVHTKHDAVFQPATDWRCRIRHEIKRQRLPRLYRNGRRRTT